MNHRNQLRPTPFLSQSVMINQTVDHRTVKSAHVNSPPVLVRWSFLPSFTWSGFTIMCQPTLLRYHFTARYCYIFSVQRCSGTFHLLFHLMLFQKCKVHTIQAVTSYFSVMARKVICRLWANFTPKFFTLWQIVATQLFMFRGLSVLPLPLGTYR